MRDGQQDIELNTTGRGFSNEKKKKRLKELEIGLRNYEKKRKGSNHKKKKKKDLNDKMRVGK